MKLLKVLGLTAACICLASSATAATAASACQWRLYIDGEQIPQGSERDLRTGDCLVSRVHHYPGDVEMRYVYCRSPLDGREEEAYAYCSPGDKDSSRTLSSSGRTYRVECSY